MLAQQTQTTHQRCKPKMDEAEWGFLKLLSVSLYSAETETGNITFSLKMLQKRAMSQQLKGI